MCAYCDLCLIQVEVKYFIQLHVNGNATLGNKNTLTLVVLRKEDMIPTNKDLSGKFHFH